VAHSKGCLVKRAFKQESPTIAYTPSTRLAWLIQEQQHAKKDETICYNRIAM